MENTVNGVTHILTISLNIFNYFTLAIFITSVINAWIHTVVQILFFLKEQIKPRNKTYIYIKINHFKLGSYIDIQYSVGNGNTKRPDRIGPGRSEPKQSQRW